MLKNIRGDMISASLITFIYWLLCSALYSINHSLGDRGDYGSFVGGVFGSFINVIVCIFVGLAYESQVKYGKDEKERNSKDLWFREVMLMVDAVSVCGRVGGDVYEYSKDLTAKISFSTEGFKGEGNRTKQMTTNAALYKESKKIITEMEKESNAKNDNHAAVNAYGELFFKTISMLIIENRQEHKYSVWLILKAKLNNKSLIFLCAWIDYFHAESKESLFLKEIPGFLQLDEKARMPTPENYSKTQ